MKPKYALWAGFALYMSLLSCKKDFVKEKVTALENVENAVALTGTKPNIILIIGDDIGYEIPTCNGGQSYQTPNIDFMAINGTQFPNCFSHPDGPPTKLALMTGKYNFRNFIEARYISPTDKTIGNMLHDADYATGYVGKWLLSGGDVSIKSHGFDDYLVFMPYNADVTGHDQWYRRYKDPLLYKNGAYLSNSEVKGKYSEDLYYNYISNFIDKHKSSPFFLIYSSNLAQHPYSPTPDHPDFSTWSTAGDERSREDFSKYYAGMIKYMDKTIGKVISKIDDAGLKNNTIILFTSDNGTGRGVTSFYKGDTVRGKKLGTTRTSINVPLIAYGPGIVLQNKIDTSLIDATDFLPTFANIAKRTKPKTWGALDGITFYDNLTGNANSEREHVYCYWPTDPNLPTNKEAINITSFIYDYNYKLYDSLHGYKFFNIRKDVHEKSRLLEGDLTKQEKMIRNSFKKILDSCITLANH